MSRRRDEHERVERRVESRVAEALSAAGVDEARVRQEVLWLMPREFVREYEALFDAALKIDAPGFKGGDENGGIGKSGKGWRGRWTVRNELALQIKKEVDEDLRNLAGRMKRRARKSGVGVGAGAGTGTGAGRGKGRWGRGKRLAGKCGGCKKWREQGWVCCPWCGNVYEKE